jgi:hypothetical protein
MGRRVDLLRILSTPALRRELFVDVIIATQARENIVTTRAQAEAAYDAVQEELRGQEKA